MNAPQKPVESDKNGSAKRRKALMALTTVVVLGGGVWLAYEKFIASHYETTDNAYVQGNVIQITPQVSGTVMSILADDTDLAKAGQKLVQLDPADVRVALEQSEATLGQTVRQVRTLYANNSALAAQVALREADLTKAQNEVTRATDDVNRRQALAGNGAVSKEELSHAQAQLAAAKSALAAAQAAVVAAREQLSSNQAMTDGTSVAQHPTVKAAAAKLREAWLASQRMELLAPVDGYIAKRTVQVGQKVAAGSPLLSIIPLDQLWVDANFKEVQLRNIRIGQPVKLTADLYGKKVEYDGKVAGLGVGTGAAFALLPAQNATGNWIKIVQRVPVRVTLNAEQLKAHPLRVGLSMEATVNTADRDGPSLADTPRQAAVAQTQVFDNLARGAEAEITRIIAANLGSGK